MKIALPLLLVFYASQALADTTVRVDVDPDSGAVTTRSFDTSVGHNFNDRAQVSAYLTGTVGQDGTWLDLSYTGGGWQYFAAAHDSDNTPLPFTPLERRVVPSAGGSHVSEHFRLSLTRAYLDAHIDQGSTLEITGKNGSIHLTLPAVFIHDYLETLDKTKTSKVAVSTAREQRHFGAQYVVLEPAFAHILGLPPAQGGLLVTEVHAGSVAGAAGLQQGDVLQELGGKPLDAAATLEAVLATETAGTTAPLRIWRAGGSTELMLKF